MDTKCRPNGLTIGRASFWPNSPSCITSLRGRLALATSDTNNAYILPEILRQFCTHYPLVTRPVEELPAREIGLVERKDTRRSPPIVAFLQLLQEHLAQQQHL